MLPTMAGRRWIALLLLLATLGLSAGASTVGAHPRRHRGRVYLHTLSSVLLFKPRSFLISGDSTLLVKHLRWRSWGGATAVGTGLAGFNYCVPDCAAGRFHFFPARLTLSRKTRCRPRHHTIYTVTRLVVVGRRRPRHYAGAQILTAPCRGAGTLT